MAANARFELASASPEELGFSGNYSNGQRGNYPSSSLDRSGSFREGGEGRMFSSGTGSARGNATSVGDLPPLSECLMLEPIMMGDQKYPLSGELRRALGVSFGSNAEDSHAKPPPPVATEELKRIKASVADTSTKARGRAKRLDESLHRLNKYWEARNSKKHQRNELFANERSGGSNMLKIGSQIQRNPPDQVTQRPEDRTKNVTLHKRVRTSIAEIRAEGRNNAFPRQPLVIGKDRDTLKDGGAGSELVDEKIRKLPAGGEGWDKKMKRKRSVGSVFMRPMDGDGDLKRAMHQKLGNEPCLQSCDAQGFRSGSLNGTAGINKLDSSSFPASSNARVIPKNDLALARDLSAGLAKERVVAKGNNKLNIRDDNPVISPSPVTKGKGSRAPRTGPVVGANLSANFPRSSGALEGWEQPSTVNKVQLMGGANNRKRPMPTGSSSPPMAQWVGQRPQKISRTRRTNLVSPVSNHDEVQTSSEGCSPSDFGARITSSGSNGSLLAKGVANGTQQLKMKLENVSSPARLSESEESGAAENSLKGKGMGGGEAEERSVNGGLNVGPSVLLSRKSKLLIKEEIGDGVRRQGRSGRGSSFSRASISPMREKSENPASTKPLRNARLGSDKNGSKSGRPPLKKLSDRKALTRLGQTPNCSSPDFTGDSDDDREELLAAAKFACNASYLGCSNSFWEKMQPKFVSVSLGDSSYLKQQLKSAEELHESLFGHGDNDLGDLVHEESPPFEALVSGQRERSLLNHAGSKESAWTTDLVDQFQDTDALFGRDSKRWSNEGPPLYQILLSALIVNDEVDEFEENYGGRDVSFRYDRDGSPRGTCLHIDPESRKRDRMEFKYESMLGLQTQGKSSSNGNSTLDRRPTIHNPLCNGELSQDCGCMHSDVGVYPGFSENGLIGPEAVLTNVSAISSFDCQYEQMHLDDKLLLELQSIGLYPETVPDLSEGEDEKISKEIAVLKKGLYQQVGKKKVHLQKIYKANQEVKEVERRDLEQIAINRLTEMAYKKQLAARGTNASKGGASKVSKQVALAFVKRTLARCRKFEETGKSCFSEPALQDVLLTAPRSINDAESMKVVGTTVANDMHLEASNCLPEPRVPDSFPSRAEDHDGFESHTHSSDQSFARSGPISNRGKKKEVLLDDVGGSAALRATSTLGNTLLGGAKGKRSERERDKDTLARNSVAKAGRPSLSNVKGERKTKSKPKQKTAQLSSSGNGFVTHSVYPSGSGSSELVTNGSNKKRDVGLMPPSNIPQDSSKDIKEPLDFTNLPLHELDSIEELGAASEIGEHQDISAWFNGLQDHDSAGLEIPMDDLADLMFN